MILDKSRNKKRMLKVVMKEPLHEERWETRGKEPPDKPRRGEVGEELIRKKPRQVLKQCFEKIFKQDV